MSVCVCVGGGGGVEGVGGFRRGTLFSGFNNDVSYIN